MSFLLEIVCVVLEHKQPTVCKSYTIRAVTTMRHLGHGNCLLAQIMKLFYLCTCHEYDYRVVIASSPDLFSCTLCVEKGPGDEAKIS